jgi:hypothetical protein
MNYQYISTVAQAAYPSKIYEDRSQAVIFGTLRSRATVNVQKVYFSLENIAI